ncbi:MAG: hypothetical protein ACRDDA_00740, partial [Aeromonas sp.]
MAIEGWKGHVRTQNFSSCIVITYGGSATSTQETYQETNWRPAKRPTGDLPRDQLETCQETNWRPAKREMNCFIPLSALSHSVKDGCTSLELFTDR